MNQELLKKHIQKNVEEVAEKFQEREDIICRFEKPILVYADAEDVRFDALFARGLSEHPKKIYRPGKCIILHYTPYAEDIVLRNEASDVPTEEWRRAYMESLWLAMEINRTIVRLLAGQGRLTSYLSSMMDWNRTNCHEDWSNRLAAVVSGLGVPGPVGSLIVDGRYGGRVSGIITDGLYAEPAKKLDQEEVDKAMKEILTAAEPSVCSEEMIAICPGKAISAIGIDKFKCQEYCLTLNEHIPFPEVCGKCFKFGI